MRRRQRGMDLLFARKRRPPLRQRHVLLFIGVTTVLVTVFHVKLLTVSSSNPPPLHDHNTTATTLLHDDGDIFTQRLSSQVFLPFDVTSNSEQQHHRYAYPGDTLAIPHECQKGRQEKFCRSLHKKVRCFSHEPEVMPDNEENSNDDDDESSSTCKTLWFSGFGDGLISQCTQQGGRGIRMEYAAALASAREHAPTVLQPVLLLSGVNQNTSSISTWAREQGAIVVTVDRLSFQEDVERWNQGDVRMGPYLRMDIPQIIKKHGLFDLPGICQQHVLYTDADVLFVNPIFPRDMQALKQYMVHRQSTKQRWWKNILPSSFSWAHTQKQQPPIVLYGREWHMQTTRPLNTGVMLMDVPGFRKELAPLIEFRNQHKDPSKFYAFDQGWLNLYFGQNKTMERKRHLLPLYWNWKLYWKLDPSVYSHLKIVHFHGPKPTVGAKEMATCNIDHVDTMPLDYRALIEDATCCDQGKTASRVLRFFERMKPPTSAVC